MCLPGYPGARGDRGVRLETHRLKGARCDLFSGLTGRPFLEAPVHRMPESVDMWGPGGPSEPFRIHD